MPIDRKKSTLPRRVWRVTPDAPMGEFVDVDAVAASHAPVALETTPKVLDPAPVVDWRGSSWDLLNGCEVSDDEDTVPGELFDEFFKR